MGLLRTLFENRWAGETHWPPYKLMGALFSLLKHRWEVWTSLYIYLKENEDRSRLNAVSLSGKKQVSFHPARNLLLPSQSLLFQAKA